MGARRELDGERREQRLTLDPAVEPGARALATGGLVLALGAAGLGLFVGPTLDLLSGLSPAEARGTLRLSVGHGLDEADIDRVLGVLPDLVARVRRAEPL